MREGLDQMVFVVAAYGVSVLLLGALLVWSAVTMRSAERRRDLARTKRAPQR
ncbi:heme exporter protein CcmD [Erythrobacteraceae bacterium CFH 75059]|uniref:heme exporter protein CcmD n=1 Tax=Qipengyuania thermophila TaxID=2509361 RepID=UPI00101F37F0|nr:heme exporter protein CcmD [Qipengyuania thermophila]TCD05026.1 heme exporter protein CcmD [Erythrobacteraceae bacterium CFH 75059]